MRLTAKKVEALKKRPGRYSDGLNLKLQVISPTNSSWLFCYEKAGRAHMMGLGPTHTISLKLARERAHAARLLLLDGKDPLAAKRAARDVAALEVAKNVTFITVTDRYITAHEKRWKSGAHGKKFMSRMKAYAFPVIGTMAVSTINETMVLAVLQPIWTTKCETAQRVRQQIEAVLDFASAAKLRQGGNPARWAGNLEHLLPPPSKVTRPVHHPALPYAEVAAFITRLREMNGTPARALEFLILTATRTSEVVGARWEEFDLQAATWTIPAERMKGGKEHRIPLAPRAIELLSGLYAEADNPFTFIGSRVVMPIGVDAMFHVVKAINSGITTHGFRSTFSDWAHERTSFPDSLIEMSLAHTVGNAVARAYRRGDLADKRRKLMAAWAQFCSTAAPEGAVVPLLRGVR